MPNSTESKKHKIKDDQHAYISVELANEARKITVLEIFRKQSSRELVRVPHNEAIASSAPGNDRIR